MSLPGTFSGYGYRTTSSTFQPEAVHRTFMLPQSPQRRGTLSYLRTPRVDISGGNETFQSPLRRGTLTYNRQRCANHGCLKEFQSPQRRGTLSYAGSNTGSIPARHVSIPSTTGHPLLHRLLLRARRSASVRFNPLNDGAPSPTATGRVSTSLGKLFMPISRSFVRHFPPSIPASLG